MSGQRVAVIGGGPSGLAAAKACLEVGLQPTVFEKSRKLGGLWKAGKGGLVWPSLRTNLSRHTCCFSDFIWPEGSPLFPSSAQISEYMEGYGRHFGLERCVRFGYAVTSVDKDGHGKWRVKFKPSDEARPDMAWIHPEDKKKEEKEEVEWFERCIVATGVFSRPSFPPGTHVEGIEEVLGSGTGSVVHCAQYKGPEPFRGKVSLVVGCAYSGAEIASEIAGVSKRCLVSTGRPSWFTQRLMQRPLSSTHTHTDTTTSLGSPRPPPAPTVCAAATGGVIPVDLAFYSRKGRAAAAGLPKSERNARSNRYLLSVCGDPGDVHERLRVLGGGGGGIEDPPRVVISETLLDRVRAGLVEVFPRLTGLGGGDGTLASFVDGTQEQVDRIVFCTGFKTELSFLHQEILETLEYQPSDLLLPVVLHHQTIHPQLPDLAFVGMYRGPFFGVLEMQARWVSRMWAGLCPFPTEAEAEAGLRESRGIRNQEEPRPNFPTDYVDVMEAIASAAGLGLGLGPHSSSGDLRHGNGEGGSHEDGGEGGDGSLRELLWSGPTLPCHYRLGPEEEMGVRERALEEIRLVNQRFG